MKQSTIEITITMKVKSNNKKEKKYSFINDPEVIELEPNYAY